MSAIFAVSLPYKVRCNLPDCHSGNLGGAKITNHPFKIELDGTMCTFCSPYHARLGEERWQEKKDKNIRLGIPPKKEEEYIGDNLSEIVENE